MKSAFGKQNITMWREKKEHMRWQEAGEDSRARVSAEKLGMGGRVVETGRVTGKNHVAGIQCRHENTARKLSDRERWWSCLTGLGDLIKRLDLFYRQKGGLAARLSG